MKITTNGKRLKNDINVALIKGKYNKGLLSENSSLGNEIRLTATKEYLTIENGDMSTYIRIESPVSECDSPGRFCVNAETLLKYLPDEECTIITVEGIIKVAYGNSIAELPSLERHQYAHVMERFSPMCETNHEESESLQVTEKLTLSTKVAVHTNALVESLKTAEKVGTSVYTFGYDGETLTVSSEKGSQNFSTRLETVDGYSGPSVGSFSLPIVKPILQGEDDWTYIYYDDEMPFVFVNGGVTILRAPRLEA